MSSAAVNVGGPRASAVRDAVAALADQALHPADLLDEVERRIGGVVAYDSAAWWTVDPESLVATELGQGDGQGRAEIPSAADFDVFDRLDIEGRDAHAEPQMLHVLARSGDATWATARFVREEDRPPFNQIEANYLASVARYVGAGIREYLSRVPWQPAHSDVPGVLVVDADARIIDLTPDAASWLDTLGVRADKALPGSLRGLVARTLDQQIGPPPLRPAKVRIRLPDGGWIVARAARFTADQRTTAILMKAATRADMRGLFLAVYGLTPREREVTEMLIAGVEPSTIAAHMNLSLHTVRSHIKTIFTKVEVSSRAELTATLSSR